MIPTYRHYLFQPFAPVGTELKIPDKVTNYNYLTFQIEIQGLGINPMLDPGKSWYRYRCFDCLGASGDYDHGFTTIYQPAKDMKNGPTNFQADEITEHARQHQIMWSWVNSIERKK